MDIYLFYCYMFIFMLSIAIHISVGICIKQKIKKSGKYDEFIIFNEQYKQEKNLKDYFQYGIFLIPLFNLMVSFIEIANRNKVYFNILKEMKEKKKCGEQVKVQIQDSIEELNTDVNVIEENKEDVIIDLSEEYHRYLESMQ